MHKFIMPISLIPGIESDQFVLTFAQLWLKRSDKITGI